MDQVLDHYEGKVNSVLAHFPINRPYLPDSTLAVYAAQSAECV
jgi:hypothetical protein